MARKRKKKTTGRQAAERSALERLSPLLSPQGYDALLEELDKPLRGALRVNPLKVPDPVRAVESWSEQYGWAVSPVPFCKDGWWIESAETAPSMTLEHRMGAYYIQDAASMLPVALFDLPDEGEPVILDMAASPGGKTTHLSSRLMDSGVIIANDSSRDRLTALRIVLPMMG